MSQLHQNITQIKYSSIKEVGTQVRSLGIKPSEISQAMTYALELSDTKAYRLARALLLTVPEIKSFKEESQTLISWAKTSGSKERKMIAKVIRKEKGQSGDIFLVNSISSMKKEDARAFMLDYFNSGGSIHSVTKWLAMAQGILKKKQKKANSSGEAKIAISKFSWSPIDWVEDVVDAVSDGISSVVDAVISAGKTLGEMVVDVVKMAVDEIGDVVTALIDAGKSLGEILKAALEEGASAVRKFVEAIISIGKSIGEVLKSAFETMSESISDVLKALIEVGKTIGDIVLNVLEEVSDKLNSVIQGFLDIGKSITKILKSIASLASEIVQSVCKSLLELGTKISEIIGSIYRLSSSLVVGFIETLIAMSKSLGDILYEALKKGTEALRNFVQAMIFMGKEIAEVLKSAFEVMAESISTVLKALIAVGKTIGNIILAVIQEVGDKLNSVIEGLLEIGESIGKILKSVASLAGDIFKTVLSGLLEIGRSIGEIISSMYKVASNLIHNIIDVLISIGTAITDIIRDTIHITITAFKEVVSVLIRLGKTIAELLSDAMSVVSYGLSRMTQALILLGNKIIDLIKWAIESAVEGIKEVLRGILAAGKALVDIFAEVASKSISILKSVVKGFIELGKKIVDLIENVITLGIEFTKDFITVITQIVGGLVQFSAEILKFTYKTAASLVKKLLDVGVMAIEVLGMVVGSGYLVFRRIVNGIIANTGAVGEILDWVLTQVEDAVSSAWHDSLLAIRYAKGKLTDAIDWAVNKGDQAIESLLEAWESVQENLIEFYSYAATMAKNGSEKLFEYIGKATVKLENSVDYVLNYLEKDFIAGIRDFVKGVMDAGYALAELFVNIVGMTLKAFTEVIKTTLEYGVTLGELIIETMKNPEDILDNFMKAVEEAGKSIRDIYQTVIIDLGKDFISEFTHAFYEMKKAVKDILIAVAEVSLGAIATVVSILLNLLGSYRPMREDEIIEARKIYGNTFDYSTIYFSQESLTNDIIFGIQDFINGNENSRAFVTNTLVNFDVNDGDITYDTMIHELCHVWQYNDSGSFYMSEAIHAQVFGDGYNYGYDNSSNGDGAEDDLLNVITNHPNLGIRDIFELFNPEQQAQIIMHYYVRRYRNIPASNYSAWEPFQALVYA